MNGATARISLGEFIASDQLSKVGFRFGSISQDCEESFCLNAARLASLLARAFAELERENKIEAACLQLNNFFVNLELEGASKTEGGSNGPEEKKAQNDFGDDDFDLLISDVLDDPPGRDDSVGESAAETAEERTWTVTDVDFQPISRAGSDQSLYDAFIHGRIPPMQILGNHIHAIFSIGSGRTPSFLNRTTSPSPGTADSGLEILPEEYPSERLPKRGAPGGSSVFSTLLETGNHPVAVCRLLSDMIEAREGGGGARNPIASFEEVVRDLEQMSNHPRLFLRDQSNEFYSAGLNFGQRCYGRGEELRRFLEISTRLERLESSSPRGGAEAVFVSGVAGSGKSNFVQNAGAFLTDSGWTVLTAKFKREMEHNSREIVSSLFEELVADIAAMEHGDDGADVEYHRRATRAISEAMDPAHLSCLANFIPSIRGLFPDVDADAPRRLPAGDDVSLWQLVFLLSRLVGVVLGLGRNVLLCLDDLQWCDSMMLILILEIILSVGLNDRARRHFIFVGMYRDDEVSESHPLADQLSALRKSAAVRVTEIKLPSLSADGVADMIMTEMRLPRRLVSGLAGVVHKKTSGHAIFVAQVLNSLVRDSTIAYSPRNRRFDWDEHRIAALRMGDSVASLIVSNLSSLRAEALQSLRILSCFGVQIPLAMLEILAGGPCAPEGGVESFLPGLVEGGVVEVSGSSVLFSHDLIQQHVYDNIPVDERRRLHLDIGTSIASEIGLDSLLVTRSFEAIVEGLRLVESGAERASRSSPSYQLVAIATNQINVAGPESAPDRSERIRFAGWNLRAGKDAADRSNFQAALYFYKSGISFLGDALWLEDSRRLCHELHEGSASAFFAVGDHSLAVRQASAVIENVPFEDSIVAHDLRIRALDNLGRSKEVVSNGLNLLRLLKIDIPREPSPSAVMSAMADTGRAASAYSFDQITNARHMVDEKKISVLQVFNVLIISFFRSAPSYLPLVACAVVNHCLQNGICEESASAFSMFAYFKVSLEGKYEEGSYWADVVRKLLDGASAQTKATLQSDMVHTNYLCFLYCPFKELAVREMNIYQSCMALGEFEVGLYALSFSLMFSYYGGENLTLILNSMKELLELMLKHIKEGAKIALLNKMLIDELMGNSDEVFPDFGGVVRDESTLLADAQARKNILLIEAIQVKRFNSAFWMGDYAEASKCSRAISALPSARVIKVQLVVHTFFAGLVAFHTFRDGGGEEHLDEGRRVLDKMEAWSKCSDNNFNNKLLLLEAEHHASVCDIKAAKAAFEASGRSARDHGLIQEQGLACELYGRFLSSIMEAEEALRWLECAHTCYMQWGAAAKAERVRAEYELVSSPPVADVGQFINKHGREW